MSAQRLRKSLANINRYQKEIIYPVLVPSFAIGLFTLLSLAYYYNFDYRLDTGLSFDPFFLNFVIPLFLVVLLFFMVFISIWICGVSNRIVGPHERIIRELDDILADKGKKRLTIRKDDQMYKELTDRINALIKKFAG
ncbi:MAG: hypothetical protein ABIJ41_04230 [Candidatus Omnitrophota bacterium]